VNMKVRGRQGVSFGWSKPRASRIGSRDVSARCNSYFDVWKISDRRLDRFSSAANHKRVLSLRRSSTRPPTSLYRRLDPCEIHIHF
jgi:hypothetical protein